MNNSLLKDCSAPRGISFGVGLPYKVIQTSARRHQFARWHTPCDRTGFVLDIKLPKFFRHCLIIQAHIIRQSLAIRRVILTFNQGKQIGATFIRNMKAIGADEFGRHAALDALSLGNCYG